MISHALVRAPSNIALIKYMGKTDSVLNLPENSSLSMTLDSLCTWVSVDRLVSIGTVGSGGSGQVALGPDLPLGAPPSARLPALSPAGRAKVVRHVALLREALPGVFVEHGLRAAADIARVDLLFQSANTFPEASGIASSASSFAAITLATALTFAEDGQAFSLAWDRDSALKRSLSRLSRQGSGSSCRSFEGPFVLWEGEETRVVEAALPSLTHFVILVSSEAKSVSSSDAHRKVKTSPLWQGRVTRVEQRLALIKTALLEGDWAALARVVWSESWEMHSLFHTSSEPFSYWKPATIDALQWLAPQIFLPGPPIVTMDAGPNVHLIVPTTESSQWRARLFERFGAQAILEDRPGRGATIEGMKSFE